MDPRIAERRDQVRKDQLTPEQRKAMEDAKKRLDANKKKKR